jgi:hypothetical protein
MRLLEHLSGTLAICAASLSAVAQSDVGSDSTQYLLHGGHTITGLFTLSLNSGHTDLSDDVYTLAGFGGGALIDYRLVLGIYGQGLTSPLLHEQIEQQGRSFEGTFHVYHFGIWSMYSFCSHRRIHPFLSAQMGWGSAKWNFKNSYDDAPAYMPDSLLEPMDLEDNVMVRTLAAGVEFNVTHWFRPNAYVGIRSVSGLSLPATGKRDLDGLIIGVNLCFGGVGTRPSGYLDEFE